MATIKRIYLKCDKCGTQLQAFGETAAEVRAEAVENFWTRQGNGDYCGRCSDILAELKQMKSKAA